MEEEVYRRLADHLDTLPGGFAPSERGADIRLLKRLFTPAEADLATHLTLQREEARLIAARAGLPLDETARRLDEMAGKGLIFSVQLEDGPALYQAVPFVVGIFEFQVGRLNSGLLRNLGYYWSTREPRPPSPAIPQMRTIPVRQRIDMPLEALPYERVDELLKGHSKFAVAPCICRRLEKMRGKGCDAAEEACLMFDEWADFYVRNIEGRYIDRAEVDEILARADADNLVLQPSNSRQIAFICCCCSCCCGILNGLKQNPRPAAIVASAFIAAYAPESCQGCQVCLERCPMEALTADGDRVAFDADRCIGCGLCVSTCPGEALTLVRKAAAGQAEIPADISATWQTISQTQRH